jgi:hypothetical protein
MTENSRRVKLCALALFVIALGLSSRRHQFWPAPVKEYAGDALYAVLIYVLALVARPGLKPQTAWTVSFLVCFFVEFSQAIHWAWLDELRSHRLIALVLGRGFVWFDLFLYVVGATGASLAHFCVRCGLRVGQARDL